MLTSTNNFPIYLITFDKYSDFSLSLPFLPLPLSLFTLSLLNPSVIVSKIGKAGCPLVSLNLYVRPSFSLPSVGNFSFLPPSSPKLYLKCKSKMC